VQAVKSAVGAANGQEAAKSGAAQRASA